VLFFMYWAGLQQADDAVKLCVGVEMIRTSTVTLMQICDASRKPIAGEMMGAEVLLGVLSVSASSCSSFLRVVVSVC
jgi:hypothetical protein